MKNQFLILLFLTGFLNACGQNNDNRQINTPVNDSGLINSGGHTIESRFRLPEGFQRVKLTEKSFGEYLRQLPLMPHNSVVKYYDGKIKENKGIYDAVVNLEIGNKDLHQCADAVMRLRAEYLWNLKKYDKIHFNFTNGFRVDYSEWMKGKRIAVKGNKTYWIQKGSTSNTYDDFWNYMEIVFTYAGTHSLEKELVSVSTNDLQVGDIFIKGGFPGHAIIVVDAAVNPVTGEKIFLLAQSYMPAQEIQVLKNPNDEKLSPWYSVNFGEILVTPEWEFTGEQLKRFDEEGSSK